ncbi:MAG TPA: histidinol-phosphatase HisJ family protein [Firmicutes bacterium]|nr:histidinol-phosphatase HisJ family protein [Bacillota bacterium]
MIDYHIHTRLCRHAVGEIEEYAAKAKENRLLELGFADHFPLELLDANLKADVTMSGNQLEGYIASILSLKAGTAGLVIKLGIEVDYLPGRERITEKLIASYPFDFVIGSIHFLAGWDFTNPANIKGFALKDAEKIYVDYFQLLKEMAAADLFDIVGHADVVKKFGHLIDEEAAGEIRREAVAAIKKHGLCVEVNTSGWRAPVGEQYRSRSFLSDCFQRDIPVTLGSDAHSPGDVGKGFPEALALLKEIGYDRLATFNKRKRSFIAL